METIIAKGKNINEAVLFGLEQLGATKKEVDIEIIQQHNKGFMGLRSKEAIVKLNKKMENKNPNVKEQPVIHTLDVVEEIVTAISEEQIDELAATIKKDFIRDTNGNGLMKKAQPETLEGKVWVKDGHLQFRCSANHLPIITVTEPITVLKNKEKVKSKIIAVCENDTYEISVESVERKTNWKITMDEQKLSVWLHVDPGYRIFRSIPDIKPDHHITLVFQEKKEFLNTMTEKDILERLESLGVTSGINYEEILKAMKASEPSIFEIATGIKPTPGKDGWLDLKVDLYKEKGPKENEKGHVDYREIFEIPTVERGVVIASVHPPIPGNCGYTVTNEVVPPKQTYPVVAKAGKGTIIVEDKVEDKIVATDLGRPHIEKRGQFIKISVMPKLTHQGNVDLASGNIRFKGDVEILGGVEAGMLVETEGNILIRKIVNCASVSSSGSIVTDGTIIGSKISAGTNNMIVVQLSQLLGTIQNEMVKMIAVIRQVMQSRAFNGYNFNQCGIQVIIRYLLTNKFKDIYNSVKQYVDIVSREEGYLQEDEWRQMAISLTKLLLSLPQEVIPLEKVIHLSEKMKELHEISQTPSEPDAFITIPNAMNSILYCSGAITLNGDGCVNTKIHSEGLVKIMGIVRGGEVYGGLGVDINEVGSEIGTRTVISVPRHQKIKINKAMEGTTIQIGNLKYKFEETRAFVRAYVNKDNQLVVE